MSIRNWPLSERPREKLLRQGAAQLSDAELLAIFLRTGTAGSSAIDLARQLIDTFGGLRPLLAARQADFCALRGLGPAKYAQLQAVLEMASRYLFESMQSREALRSPEQAHRYLQQRLDRASREIFACLFLDTRHRVLAYEELFQGTVDGASVHPREVMRSVLQYNAAAVILAHNHPSGTAEPSSADIQITERLRQALVLIDVRVLDHIIVGKGETCSLAERGLIGCQ